MTKEMLTLLMTRENIVESTRHWIRFRRSYFWSCHILLAYARVTIIYQRLFTLCIHMFKCMVEIFIFYSHMISGHILQSGRKTGLTVRWRNNNLIFKNEKESNLYYHKWGMIYLCIYEYICKIFICETMQKPKTLILLWETMVTKYQIQYT